MKTLLIACLILFAIPAFALDSVIPKEVLEATVTSAYECSKTGIEVELVCLELEKDGVFYLVSISSKDKVYEVLKKADKDALPALLYQNECAIKECL